MNKPTPTPQEGWEERFDEQFDNLAVFDSFEAKMMYLRDDIKSFISQELDKREAAAREDERMNVAREIGEKVVLKGERRRIIEQIRAEEKERVVREIGEKVKELRVFRDPADIAKGYEMSDTASCYNQGVNDALEITQSHLPLTKGKI